MPRASAPQQALPSPRSFCLSALSLVLQTNLVLFPLFWSLWRVSYLPKYLDSPSEESSKNSSFGARPIRVAPLVRSPRAVPSELGAPELLELQSGHIEQVVALEERSYPSPWSAELVRGEFLKEVSYRLGLVRDNKVLAYSFCYLIPQDLHILNIAVAPECRGRGYGQYLLCNILCNSIDAGVSIVGLEVRPSNCAARALYDKLGFHAVGIRRDYYRDNSEDALLLERQMGLDDRSFFKKFSWGSLKS